MCFLYTKRHVSPKDAFRKVCYFHPQGWAV